MAGSVAVPIPPNENLPIFTEEIAGSEHDGDARRYQVAGAREAEHVGGDAGAASRGGNDDGS